MLFASRMTESVDMEVVTFILRVMSRKPLGISYGRQVFISGKVIAFRVSMRLYSRL